MFHTNDKKIKKIKILKCIAIDMYTNASEKIFKYFFQVKVQTAQI